MVWLHASSPVWSIITQLYRTFKYKGKNYIIYKLRSSSIKYTKIGQNMQLAVRNIQLR
jgi:hypothetical protein